MISLEESVRYDMDRGDLNEGFRDVMKYIEKKADEVGENLKNTISSSAFLSGIEDYTKKWNNNIDNLFDDIAKRGSDGTIDKNNFRNVVPKKYYRYVDVSKLQRVLSKSDNINKLRNINISDYLVSTDGETEKIIHRLNLKKDWKNAIDRYDAKLKRMESIDFSSVTSKLKFHSSEVIRDFINSVLRSANKLISSNSMKNLSYLSLMVLIYSVYYIASMTIYSESWIMRIIARRKLGGHLPQIGKMLGF